MTSALSGARPGACWDATMNCARRAVTGCAGLIPAAPALALVLAPAPALGVVSLAFPAAAVAVAALDRDDVFPLDSGCCAMTSSKWVVAQPSIARRVDVEIQVDVALDDELCAKLVFELLGPLGRHGQDD